MREDTLEWVGAWPHIMEIELDRAVTVQRILNTVRVCVEISESMLFRISRLRGRSPLVPSGMICLMLLGAVSDTLPIVSSSNEVLDSTKEDFNILIHA
jgi:hypothetical protein